MTVFFVVTVLPLFGSLLYDVTLVLSLPFTVLTSLLTLTSLGLSSFLDLKNENLCLGLATSSAFSDLTIFMLCLGDFFRPLSPPTGLSTFSLKRLTTLPIGWYLMTM